MNPATEILRQLGGNRFIAMTGANNMTRGERILNFKIGKNEKKVTHVKITLTNFDLYDMTFYRVRKNAILFQHTIKDVYNSDLQKVFTENTGMYTHL